MILDVHHTSQYIYSQPVVLNPHTLYLYPRTYPHQRLLQYELRIEPVPTRIVRNLDVEGNIQQLVYFDQPTGSLQINMRARLESDEFNSFDFVLFPWETQRLPFPYPQPSQNLLQPYLIQDDVTPEVTEWASQIAANVNFNTVQFLTALSQAIRQFSYEVRPEGLPFAPAQTLAQQGGSCRDYTVLFMAACRSLGLASRFVSGYLFGSTAQQHNLHAWAEVYLPGGGWRGFDPTEGMVVVNRHIFLASTATPRLATPVSGTFSGPARSSMQSFVEITSPEVLV
jgi:transglutaminase-like putative cysteine protease